VRRVEVRDATAHDQEDVLHDVVSIARRDATLQDDATDKRTLLGVETRDEPGRRLGRRCGRGRGERKIRRDVGGARTNG
jgi:hypothetical protein